MLRRLSSSAVRRSLPIIDISPLLSSHQVSTPAEAVKVADALDAASREFGFFHATGHGIDRNTIANALNASRAFFDLSVEAKHAVRADPDAGEGTGWEPSGAQKLDENRLGDGIDGAETKETGDIKESYILGRPATAQLPPGAKPGELAALWPRELGSTFQDPLLQYHEECWRVSAALMRGWAIALGKPSDFFASEIDDPMTKLRLLHYPPVEDGRYADAIGLGSHTDWGACMQSPLYLLCIELGSVA